MTFSLQACWSNYESEDRADAIPVFKSNFGFSPVESIKDIKFKYFGFRDGTAHWMQFNYSPDVLEKIVQNDSLLLYSKLGSPQLQEITKIFTKKNPNSPEWFSKPNNTDGVFYKKDYLDHTFSEYYLWLDTTEHTINLHHHYFD